MQGTTRIVKKQTRLYVIAFLASCIVNNTVSAAGFQFYELGTPVIGTAAVGQAVTNDASTSYFNPAGMALLPTSQFMLGSVILLPNTHFSVGSANTISGGNGGDAGTLTPGVGAFYVYNFHPKLKLGISLTSPYGGDLTYTDGWVGRYQTQQAQLYALDLNPVLSYQVNNWFAFGLGATVEYANLSETVALPIVLNPSVDGQANIKVSNYAPGYNFGVMFTPSNTTKIGATYRSRILHNLTGTTTFLRLPNTPNTSTKLIMPQNVIVSLSQALSNKLNLLGELGWANWSSMQSSVVNISGYSVSTNLNWNNTYRVGAGLQYQATNQLLVQAGVSYDSSPTNATHRTADLPVDRQIRGGLGLIYKVIPAIALGFSYEYINFGSAPISSTSSLGTLQGSYGKNYANVVQMSINVAC